MNTEEEAKAAARWFKYQMDTGHEILTLRDYELKMLNLMCNLLLRKKGKKK